MADDNLKLSNQLCFPLYAGARKEYQCEIPRGTFIPGLGHLDTINRAGRTAEDKSCRDTLEDERVHSYFTRRSAAVVSITV